MVDVEFFKKFLLDFMVNVESLTKKKMTVDELFLEMSIQKLEDFTNSRMYAEFSDFTNGRIGKNKVVSTDYIEYVLNINERRFGKVYNSIHFTRMSRKITDYLESHFSMKEKMEELKGDILGFASSAPISASSLRFNIYRSFLKKIPISYIESFLDDMVKDGLLKKEGSRYVVP